MTAKELASLAKTYKDNLDTIIVTMNRKTKKPSQIDLLIKEFKEFKTEVKTEFQSIKTRLDNIEDRLDNIVTKNNLVE